MITGRFDNDERSWLAEPLYSEMSSSEQYLSSFYFTITTITTVGYGDMSAATFAEKITAIFIMFVGVIAFSFASGTLTNYIAQQDQLNAVFMEKMVVLDRLYKE